MRRESPTAAEEINRQLAAAVTALAEAVYCYVQEGESGELVAAPDTTQRGSETQIDSWVGAFRSLRGVVSAIIRRRCDTDMETLRLLSSLAAHPVAEVRVTAAAGILAAGWAPPYRVVCEMLGGKRPYAIQGMEMVPREFWYQINAHKGRIWETLCVQLADLVHGRVLTATRGETLCVNGGRPDIVIVDESLRWEGERLAWADIVIDAKCGTGGEFHKSIEKYKDICRQIEFWVGSDLIPHVDGAQPDKTRNCTVVYRYLEELIDEATAHGDAGLADSMSKFRRQTGHFTMLNAYLRMVKTRLERRMSLDLDSLEGPSDNPAEDE